jgi:hypothetical protein
VIKQTFLLVECDNPVCSRAYEHTGKAPLLALGSLRVRYERDGWRHYDARDFCPEHAEEYMSVERWNTRYQTGQKVLFWPGAKEGLAKHEGTLAQPAFRSSSGTPVVFIEGYPSYVALSHIEVVE